MNPIVVEAKRWLGTPFVAGASVRGIGTDCVGLIEGIARDLRLQFPPRHTVQHDILVAARCFLAERAPYAHKRAEHQWAEAGDLILLARDPGGRPLHAAIITQTRAQSDTGLGALIHAHWSAGVVENRFGSWFQRRVTHVFAWPQTDQAPLERRTE